MAPGCINQIAVGKRLIACAVGKACMLWQSKFVLRLLVVMCSLLRPEFWPLNELRNTNLDAGFTTRRKRMVFSWWKRSDCPTTCLLGFVFYYGWCVCWIVIPMSAILSELLLWSHIASICYLSIRVNPGRSLESLLNIVKEYLEEKGTSIHVSTVIKHTCRQTACKHIFM